MENASKALIIAGAILITMLLISVGIQVMNSSSKVSEQVESNMDSVSVQMFNSKITPYLGKNVEGSSVKELLSFLISYNNSALDNGFSVVRVRISNSVSNANLDQLYNDIAPNLTYNVSIHTGSTYATNGGYFSDGMIGHISIIKN